MKTKYFSVEFDLEKLNKFIKKYCSKEDYLDLEFKNKKEFLEIALDEFGFSLESESYGEDWEFSVVNNLDVVKIEMPEYSFGEHKNLDEAFFAFLNNLKDEGIPLSNFLGLTQISGELGRIGFDWKYKEITGPALLMLRKMETK